MTSPSPTALPALPDHVVKLIPADQWPAFCDAQTIAYSALDTDLAIDFDKVAHGPGAGFNRLG
ncbi:MAG: hypothetical protein AAFY13_05440, partial [Pseudomonadota bacterium]